jgi:hypothetical protein
VCQQSLDVEPLLPERFRHDQPVSIMTNVENQNAPNLAGIGELDANITQVMPRRHSGDPVPVKRFRCDTYDALLSIQSPPLVIDNLLDALFPI